MIEQLFFQLIRVAIGTQETLSHFPSEQEWQTLYDMAKKQSLVGICFAGVQKTISSSSLQGEESRAMGLSELLYLKWMGMAAKIQQRNEVMNGYTKRALEMFRKDGFESSVLKGQGIATLYGSLAGLRQSGDIDLWVSGSRKELYDYSLQKLGRLEGLTYHHIHFPVWKEVEIEAHTWPSFLASPIRNKRLKAFCKQNATNDDIPSLAFNRVFILLHCYRHLCGHGVGMRQMLDYYFVLLQGFSEEEKAESMKWIEALGMKKFAEATMWFMRYVFGLDEKYLLCLANEIAGRFLLNEVVHSGNMGHGEDRFDGKISDRAVSRYWYNLKRDIRLIQFCPHEAMWDPFFNVYQFIWCKIQKAK